MDEKQLIYLTDLFWDDDDYSLSQRNAQRQEDIDYAKSKAYAPEISYAYGLLEMIIDKSNSLEQQMAIAYSLFDSDENCNLPENLFLDVLEVFWINTKGLKNATT